MFSFAWLERGTFKFSLMWEINLLGSAHPTLLNGFALRAIGLDFWADEAFWIKLECYSNNLSEGLPNNSRGFCACIEKNAFFLVSSGIQKEGLDSNIQITIPGITHAWLLCSKTHSLGKLTGPTEAQPPPHELGPTYPFLWAWKGI